mmetsp:Transcript_23773/g.58275  ORF Transcript_23773/g.58275 Transcript_23773/m.58275 type:complete len:399 (-) Transcript_23773:292-1488(-)
MFSITAHSTLGVFAAQVGAAGAPRRAASTAARQVRVRVPSIQPGNRCVAPTARQGRGYINGVAVSSPPAALTRDGARPLFYLSPDGQVQEYDPQVHKDVSLPAKAVDPASKLIAKPGTVGIPHAASADTIAALADAAVGASNMSFTVLMWRSFIAGIFIGFGGILCASLGGDVPAMAMANPGMARFLFGAIGFPLSIFLVTTLGGLAFTGSLVAVGCAWLAPLQFTHGATKSRQVLSIEEGLRVLGTMFVGNCVGLLGMATMAVAGGMECVGPCAEIALHKAMETGGEAFWRAVGGGILITMAVTQSFAAKSGTEKFMGIWLCISTYVACGWEHGLANLLFFPVALMSGGAAQYGITTGSFIFGNLWPVTIGNIVGGFFLAYMLCSIHAPPKPPAAAN